MVDWMIEETTNEAGEKGVKVSAIVAIFSSKFLLNGPDGTPPTREEVVQAQAEVTEALVAHLGDLSSSESLRGDLINALTKGEATAWLRKLGEEPPPRWTSIGVKSRIRRSWRR